MTAEAAVQDQAAKDEAAAFSAGFASEIASTTNNPPAPEPAPVVPATPAPAAPAAAPEPATETAKAPEPKPAPAAPAVDEAALLAEIAEESEPDQLKALFDKEFGQLRGQLNKIAGTMGSLKEDVVKLKTAPAPAKPAEPETPAVDLSEFDSTYPEFVARMNEAIKVANNSGATPQVQQQIVDLALQFEEFKLGTRHSDWRDVVNSPEYQTWLGAQTPEVQKVAMETPSADELAGVIGSYKDFSKSQDKGAKNRKRLEEAVVPTVPTAGPARAAEPTEEDMFRQGFASIAGRK